MEWEYKTKLYIGHSEDLINAFIIKESIGGWELISTVTDIPKENQINTYYIFRKKSNIEIVARKERKKKR